ncbi:MAG: Ger(x)C family spore germination protein [Tepidanaerobacteraceae bacterium]|nr:Ger(x)C family spore germination protein [Tepidanaerobacteraceae bacterium]
MKKNLILLCIILAVLLNSSGCWNQRELNTIAIAAGIGIDVEKSGTHKKIKLTAQIVRPARLSASSGEQKGGSSSQVLVLDSTGDTVFDAVRNFTMLSSRKLFFPHNQVIVIGEEAARDGVRPLLDFFVRDHENRGRVWLLVCRGKAGDILRAKAGQEEIPALGIAQLEEAGAAASRTRPMRLHEFVNNLLSKTTSPAVSNIELVKQEDKKAVKLSGSAFFKDGKLAGFLDETESRGLLWVEGKVKSGIIAVSSPDSGEKLSLEIIRATSKVIPHLKDGSVSVDVVIKEEGNLGDEMCGYDITSPVKLSIIEKRQSEVIKKEVEAAIKKARECKADIFGFGEAVQKKYPVEWKSMERDWQEIFPEIEIKVAIQAKIRRVGMTVKPLEPE